MGEPPLKLIVTGTIAAVAGGLILAWLSSNVSKSASPQLSHTANAPSGTEDRSQVVPIPKSRPKPKPLIARAGESIRVGDFTFVMNKCSHTKDKWLVCTGTVVDQGDYRLTVKFTGGSAIDDKGSQNQLTTNVVGSMAGLFLGGGDGSSQELTPTVPMRFGFVLKWNADATSFNFDLRFSTSGQPATSQITFVDIPVLD